jgi:thiol-disulfide isomerase/thioredoxin
MEKPVEELYEPDGAPPGHIRKDAQSQRFLLTLFLTIAVGAALAVFFSFFQQSFQPRQQPRDLGIQPLPSTRAHPFRLSSLDGREISLADLRGKVVFLNFWATWCEPCKVEMPHMEKLLHRLAGKGLAIVAVDLKEDQEQVAQYALEQRLTFPILLDRSGIVGSRYDVRQIPTTFLIDREGKFIGKAIGPRDWSDSTAIRYFDGLLKQQ